MARDLAEKESLTSRAMLPVATSVFLSISVATDDTSSLAFSERMLSLSPGNAKFRVSLNATRLLTFELGLPFDGASVLGRFNQTPDSTALPAS